MEFRHEAEEVHPCFFSVVYTHQTAQRHVVPVFNINECPPPPPPPPPSKQRHAPPPPPKENHADKKQTNKTHPQIKPTKIHTPLNIKKQSFECVLSQIFEPGFHSLQYTLTSLICSQYFVLTVFAHSAIRFTSSTNFSSLTNLWSCLHSLGCVIIKYSNLI